MKGKVVVLYRMNLREENELREHVLCGGNGGKKF